MREPVGLRFRHDLQGAMFGDFRVAHPIASGGMATVYLGHRASARGFVQPVALKILHPHLATAGEFVRMFVDEARIASRIDHANVCSVLEFGRAHGTLFMAMQLLHGETLSDTLKAEQQRSGVVRVAPELVASMLAQACDGLHAAYEACDERGEALHVVHRAVSPHKLHLGYDGTIRVLDFGVARAATQTLETDAVVKGRFPYMAPEQIRGEAVDVRADVWSLGVILRESASGRRLFRGRSGSEIVSAVLQGPLPAWPLHVPEALRAIADRALQRNRAERYPDTSEMSWALRHYLGSEAALAETKLSAWLHALFAERIQQKTELLRDSQERQSARPSAPLPAEVEQGDEPTRVSLEDELTTARAFSELSQLTDNSQISGSLSHIRPIAAVRAALLKQSDVFVSAPEVALVAPAARTPLRRRLLLCIGLAVVGIGLGWLTVKAMVYLIATPRSTPLVVNDQPLSEALACGAPPRPGRSPTAA